MLLDGVVIHFTGIMVYRENMDAVRIWRLSIRVISCHYSVNQSFLILNLHGL